jgi:hypothetical protein
MSAAERHDSTLTAKEAVDAQAASNSERMQVL